jgi:hypothetical protein
MSLPTMELTDCRREGIVAARATVLAGLMRLFAFNSLISPLWNSSA